MTSDQLSPMMRQYMEIKKCHQDNILFYRLGDFYEMFFDDAKTASKELDLVLTGRDCGLDERAPMCGVPHHSAEAYIARLIKKGYKVAICEQMEDPKTTKNVVKRQVIRIVTPGTIIEDSMLDESANNFIASLSMGDDAIGLAFADISTGHTQVTAVLKNDVDVLKNEIMRFAPSELIYSEAFAQFDRDKALFGEQTFCRAIIEEIFDSDTVFSSLKAQFENDAPQIERLMKIPCAACALNGLIRYLRTTQQSGVERMISLEVYETGHFMHLDASARRNLELVRTMHSDEKRGSLLWAVDQTKTAMGRRLLRSDIERPLANPVVIEDRLNGIEELKLDGMRRMDLIEALHGMHDMERLFTRIACKGTSPREMRGFSETLLRLPHVKERLVGVTAKILKSLYNQMDVMDDIAKDISDCLIENPPAILKDGWFVRDGYHRELDELRRLQSDTKTCLAEIEIREKQKTGIKNLKIGFNKVFGYYIEITNSNREMVPTDYIRKQTLSNCERFITEELKRLEEKILTARERSLQIEWQLYEELRARVAGQTLRVQKTSDAIARLDVLCAFAALATERNYCRPVIATDGVIDIRDGRHPVAEVIAANKEKFVANDCYLDMEHNRIAIITGPNMAGKSTYIRQTALIVLLAQIGCFVPAASAKIGLVDGVYTRVGASDDLSTGQSTFMVEMNEVANILKNATAKSLLILDEVGRGTSTFDGMSIARAMLEYVADKRKLGAKTLFATHYHELTDLEDQLDCVKNYNTAVKKRGEDITFLRRIIPGAVDDSYGIEVSKLAGIPDWIIKRAFEILNDLEQARPVSDRKVVRSESFSAQLTLSPPSPVEQALSNIDPDLLTPREALDKLYELKLML